MRLYGALCAAALVACSGAEPSTVTPPPFRLKPGTPPRPDSAAVSARPDPKPLIDHIQSLVGQSFSRVTLPADTFSRSSEAVHPDLACLDAAWNGARCWMMYTPYKNGDSGYENPGFLMADNDTLWKTPPAVINPIVAWPGFGAYNSDPDHAFEPGNKRLTQIYRVVADSFNKIMIMSTTNARTWTTARVAFKERNHDAISPAIVIDRDRSANIWYIRSGAEGCNATSSSVVLRTAMPDSNQRVDLATWSAAIPVKLSIPNSVIWHLDVAPIGDEGYVALVVAYAKGASCGASDLWLATSADGIVWKTFAIPAMWRGMKVARARGLSTWYRGTLRYDARTDELDIWPSGLADSRWTIFHASFKLHDMLGLLSAAQPADLKALASTQAGIRATVPMP